MSNSARVWIARAFTAMVVVGAVAGAVVLSHSLERFWIGIGIGVFAVVATVPSWGRHVLAALCAAILALLALVTVAVLIRVLLDALSIGRGLPIWVGLALAVAIFTGVAAWYLHGNWLGANAASRASEGRAAGATQRRARKLQSASPHWSWKASLVCAAVLALVVIIGGPLLAAALLPDPERVADNKDPVSQIDVLFVSERPSATALSQPDAVRSDAPAPYADAAGFDVRYSVGFVDGNDVRWTLTGSSDKASAIAALRVPNAPAVTPPEPLNGADRVLLLLVDGTPPVVDDFKMLRNLGETRGEINRWRRVARAAAPSGTPSFALLEAKPGRRLREWNARFIKRGTYVNRGAVVSAQGLASHFVTDAAVRLAVGAPTAREDFSLALKHRPILRFDSGERAPRPLSVDDLFTHRNVKLCLSRNKRGTECSTMASARALKNGDSHLELTLPSEKELKKLANSEYKLQAGLGSGGAAAEPEPPEASAALPPGTPPPPVRGGGAPVLGAGSAIYVHAVPVETEDSSLLYLDYWWYLPYNPARSGNGAFCGPGFVIPGITCFDHVSDWEGVTVIIDRTRTEREPTPVAVHYAQHSSVARYTWEALQTAWRRDANAKKILAETPDGALRPIVFVANGTHASYPRPCKANCGQVVEKAEESKHDGRLPWVGNTAATCGTAICLKLLPTVHGGRDPALWNAFAGQWGKRHCFLTYYCDSSSSPEAPGRQDRYQRPWNYDATPRP